MNGPIPTEWAPLLLSVLRIVTGFLFVTHGTEKLFGLPHKGPGTGKPVPIASMFGVAGTLELVGGSMLMFGVFTQPVAFVLSGLMAVAYFKAHAPQGFWPTINDGESAVAYCFICLYLAAAGGGQWTLDALRHHATP